jgi:hypothetical protein
VPTSPKTLCLAAVLSLGSIAQAGTNRVGLMFGNPGNCGPVSPFTAPQWRPNTSYHGVLPTQLGNAWVRNGGRFYRNETGHAATSGPGDGPTAMRGTQVDGGVIWRFYPNNNTQCGDDIAHYVYPLLDFVTFELPWSADHTTLGFESSNADSTGHRSYNFANFDATISNSKKTGITDNPNWPPGKKVRVIASPVQGTPAIGGNSYSPDYIFSTAFALSLGAGPQDVAVCDQYPGDRNPAMGGTKPHAIFNIESPGVTLSNVAHGWPGMYEVPASTAWRAALAVVIHHYNLQPKRVDSLRIAPGQGGESFMACASTWQAALGFSNDQMRELWEMNYKQRLVDSVNADRPAMPVGGVTNCESCTFGGTVDYSWADLFAWNMQEGSIQWQLSANGLARRDLALYAANGAQAGSGISSDHAFIWEEYPRAPKVFQTLAVTDPNGAGVGSLVKLLAWQKDRCAAATLCDYEASWQDLCTAACPNYVNFSTYHVAYMAALVDFRGRRAFPFPYWRRHSLSGLRNGSFIPDAQTRPER